MKNLAAYIDHTLLKAAATAEEIDALCREAARYSFASVCVNPSYVARCAGRLKGTGVKVCTVIGFPLGATTSLVKAVEARDAVAAGADELDMVINIGALRSGDRAAVEQDIAAVRAAAKGKVLKVIVETCFLSRKEKEWVCRLVRKLGADFIKTSTGFGTAGAAVEDVALFRKLLGRGTGIKASGGIKTRSDAEKMIAAGATRIGTSSGVAILQDR